jgi:nitroreductase / dihydropteridine reductase
MDFQDVVRNRYANRSYTDQKVPEDTVRELLDLMRHSCSALNLQPWRVRVVNEQEEKDRLYEATWGEKQVKACSHVLVLCADTDYQGIIERYERGLIAAGVDEAERRHLIGAATEESAAMTYEQKLHRSQNQVHIMLGNAVNGAFALGLASCPMAAFYPDKVATAMELPENLVPTVLVSLGYPVKQGSTWWRYSVAEILV